MGAFAKLITGGVTTGLVLLLTMTLIKTLDSLPPSGSSPWPVTGFHLAALLNPLSLPAPQEAASIPLQPQASSLPTPQTAPANDDIDPAACERPAAPPVLAPQKRMKPRPRRPARAAEAVAALAFKRALAFQTMVIASPVASRALKHQIVITPRQEAQLEKLRRLAERDAVRYGAPLFIKGSYTRELK